MPLGTHTCKITFFVIPNVSDRSFHRHTFLFTAISVILLHEIETLNLLILIGSCVNEA